MEIAGSAEVAKRENNNQRKLIGCTVPTASTLGGDLHRQHWRPVLVDGDVAESTPVFSFLRSGAAALRAFCF